MNARHFLWNYVKVGHDVNGEKKLASTDGTTECERDEEEGEDDDEKNKDTA